MNHLIPWVIGAFSTLGGVVSLFFLALSAGDAEGRGGGWIEYVALGGLALSALGIVVSIGLIIWNAFH